MSDEYPPRQPFVESDIEIGGLTLNVRTRAAEPGTPAGTGRARPTLVFLHDSLGGIRLWRDFPGRLGDATGLDILLYDRQGHGKSSPLASHKRGLDYLHREADILEALLGKYGIGKAILFGHSDGGSIALIAASRYPGRIAGIVTEAAHIYVEEATLEGLRKAEAAYRTTDLKARMLKHHGDRAEILFRAWTETWLSAEYRSLSLADVLPGIRCPSLIIQGVDDGYATEGHVDAILNGLGGPAEKFMVPGAGHSPHKEAAAAVLAKSAEFIRAIAALESP